MRIEQLVSADSGWRAVFKEPDGGESLSRIIGWAILGGGDEHELAGVIIDPSEPRIRGGRSDSREERRADDQGRGISCDQPVAR
jgi:hypothetical protein